MSVICVLFFRGIYFIALLAALFSFATMSLPTVPPLLSQAPHDHDDDDDDDAEEDEIPDSLDEVQVLPG